jgi:hypothetical protein
MLRGSSGGWLARSKVKVQKRGDAVLRSWSRSGPQLDTRTARDGLLQVLTHSSQHRSQVLSWLSAQGVRTPDLDYVVMLGEQRGMSQ